MVKPITLKAIIKGFNMKEVKSLFRATAVVLLVAAVIILSIAFYWDLCHEMQLMALDLEIGYCALIAALVFKIISLED